MNTEDRCVIIVARGATTIRAPSSSAPGDQLVIKVGAAMREAAWVVDARGRAIARVAPRDPPATFVARRAPWWRRLIARARGQESPIDWVRKTEDRNR